MSLLRSAFHLPPENVDKITSETTASFREMFQQSNAQFETYSAECAGPRNCICLEKDYKNFMMHFQAAFVADSNYRLLRKSCADTHIDYIYICAG